MPSIFILTAINIILFILFLIERQRRLKLEKEGASAAVEKARQQTLEMLHQATIKAQAILGQAIQQEMSISQVQEAQMKTLEQATEKKFDAALQAYIQYLTTVREKAGQVLNQQTQRVFDKFEQNLSDFLIQTQQKSTHAVELEMQAARSLIDIYKRQQLNLVDEHIIAILERTLSLVLAKKLSLEDQVNFINEALEKAKAEKFII